MLTKETNEMLDESLFLRLWSLNEVTTELPLCYVEVLLNTRTWVQYVDAVTAECTLTPDCLNKY